MKLFKLLIVALLVISFQFNAIAETMKYDVSDVSIFSNEDFKKDLQNKINEKLDKLQENNRADNVSIIEIKELVDKLVFYSLRSNKLKAVSEMKEDYEGLNVEDDANFRKADFQAAYRGISNLKDNELKQYLKKVFGKHKNFGYKGARQLMFSNVDNYDGYVECVYTGRKLKTKGIPDHTNMNCEHTWPQSKGATGIAKSDLNHLFPTDSKANSQRSSHPFGPVSGIKWEQGGSKLGKAGRFEPRDEHKGNVARAMFYFSTIYNRKLDSRQEKALKAWNKLDPVDAQERERNDRVEKHQLNRNPFIDHPELADQISDF